MSLDPAAVRRIAKLARIHVDDVEVPMLQAQLNGILRWIEQLQEVDVEDVEPLTGIGARALTMRDDVVTDGGLGGALLRNAPEPEGPFFTVPKVIE